MLQKLNFERLTKEEVKEFFKLKEKIFGKEVFVIADLNNPDQKRYDELMSKIMNQCGFKGE